APAQDFYSCFGRTCSGEVLWHPAIYLPDLGQFLLVYTYPFASRAPEVYQRFVTTDGALGSQTLMFTANSPDGTNTAGAVDYDTIAHRVLVAAVNSPTFPATAPYVVKAAVLDGN